jgi:hypothetical protein
MSYAPNGGSTSRPRARAGSAPDSEDEIMDLMSKAMVVADREACWATRLVWGALLAWLSPVFLLVLTIGLVGMAASRSVTLAAKLAPGRASALPAPLAEPMNHAA